MECYELAAEKPKRSLTLETRVLQRRYIFQTRNGLVIGYDGDPLSSALDLEMERGQKIVLAQRYENGIGKTTLLKSILGLIKPLLGSVTFEDYLKFGLLLSRRWISGLQDRHCIEKCYGTSFLHFRSTRCEARLPSVA